MNSLLHRATGLKRAVILTATVLLAVGWLLFLRPTSLGGPAGYVLVSGTSMQPTYETGDLVVTQRQATYAVGDIVEFRVNRALIIHRIVGGDPVNGYLTRGDNNHADDGFHPTADAINGKAWIHLSGVGRLIVIVRSPLPLAICTWAFATFYLLRRWNGPRVRPSAEA